MLRWISILNLAFLSYSWSILCADESKSEEEAKVETKEELWILQSWIEVGGLPVLDEVEVQKLLWEVYSLSLLDIHMGFQPFFLSLCLLYILHLCLCVSFLGARQIKEARQLEEEAQHIETALLGKIEVAVAGSEVEGLYRLLRGAISHPSISSAPPPSNKVCHTPSATISCPTIRSLEVLYLKPPILQ